MNAAGEQIHEMLSEPARFANRAPSNRCLMNATTGFASIVVVAQIVIQEVRP
jgi:hypothetical protein